MTAVSHTRAAHGRTVSDVDPCGGIFAPAPGLARPVAGARVGPPSTGVSTDVIFQCPQSAIPDAVWDLLALWWQCRTSGLPPVAGGFLDQPVIVRQAWPVFEAEMRRAERLSDARASEQAMTAALAVLARPGRH